ncbi:MAG TPA: hypothetical protein DDZ68_14450 [Parvularcula sp.]|nr:hypothetical protein [Parvularcula sp.]HBS30309.1 hypothetical protein [Parvularcula sp.]
MKRLFLACVLLAAVALPARGAAPSEAPPRSIEEFREQVGAVLKSAPGAPSAGLVLIENGDVVFQGGVGVADHATARLAGEQTHYRIGSISKMFVAMAVMQQVERGKLSLDASVAELAPELPLENKWAAQDPVRVVHLLEHTAGFDDMHYRNWLTPSDRPLAEVVRDLDAELVARWRPGQWHAYSNPGYAAAAYLVEKSSGMRFEDYVDRELLGPIGMHETFWTREPAGSSLAAGIEKNGQPAPWHQLKLSAAGALISTPRDMAKLAAFLVSRGETAPGVLSEASLTRMERAETTASARAGLTFSYGLGNYTRQVNNLAFHGHDGSLPGYLSTVLYSQETKIAFAVMVATSDYDVFAKVRKLAANYLLRNSETPKEGAFDGEAVVDSANNGYYYPANPQNSLWGGLARTMNGARLTAEGDRYRFAPPITPFAAIDYFPMPGEQLRDPGKSMATGVFFNDAEGRRAFTDIDAVYVRGSWWSVALPQYGVVAAVLLMISTLLFALAWAPRLMFGGLRVATHVSTRAWPLLATLVFIAACATATQLRLTDMLGPNVKTVLFSALGWLFGLLALIGVIQSLRTFRAQRQKIIAVHSLAASLAALCLAAWLWSIGLLGVQLWAW